LRLSPLLPLSFLCGGASSGNSQSKRFGFIPPQKLTDPGVLQFRPILEYWSTGVLEYWTGDEGPNFFQHSNTPSLQYSMTETFEKQHVNPLAASSTQYIALREYAPE
jgi:hypothetical protein